MSDQTPDESRTEVAANDTVGTGSAIGIVCSVLTAGAILIGVAIFVLVRVF